MCFKYSADCFFQIFDVQDIFGYGDARSPKPCRYLCGGRQGKPKCFYFFSPGKNPYRLIIHGNMTMIHDDHPVSHSCFLHVMGDPDDSHACLFIQLPDCFKHLPSTLGIQHGRCLIQNHHRRLHGYDTGDRHTLFLPA